MKLRALVQKWVRGKSGEHRSSSERTSPPSNLQVAPPITAQKAPQEAPPKEPSSEPSGLSPTDPSTQPSNVSIPYTIGELVVVDRDFLSRCKSLAVMSGAYQMNATTVIKSGEDTSMAEAVAMRLVREKTTIPVPTVHDAYVQENDDRRVIIMEFIPGQRLDEAWSSYSTSQKESILLQLKGYMEELRALEGSDICATDGSVCKDQFFEDELEDCNVYKNNIEFSDAIAKRIVDRSDDPWSRMVARFLQCTRSSRTVLTHNDLAPRNILVRDGKIVAILDWELCGFFPEYWEYIKCFLWNDWSSSWLRDGIPDRILQPWPEELSYYMHVRELLM